MDAITPDPSPHSSELVQNEEIAWHLDREGDRLRSTGFLNKRSGHTFPLSGAREIALTFSAAVDRVAEPIERVDDFELRGITRPNAHQLIFDLYSPAARVSVTLYYRLEGATRRKWAEVRNEGDTERLLLDVELDHFGTGAAASGGGHGQPVFLGDEAFAAIEHPAGWNEVYGGRVLLRHHPGRRLAPGQSFRTYTSLVSVAPEGRALEHFVAYVQERCLRPKRVLSVYTPFGTNCQWGGCPTLDDEQTLDVLGVLGRWQRKGVHFDYFTLDTGWVDPSSDLTRFRPIAYPNGPGEVVERVGALGMKLGLWFATSWAAESCWDYLPAWTGLTPPPMAYRNGYPAKASFDGMFCMGSETYTKLLESAVLHHVRENGVRFLKLDGGSYACDSTEHGHLPGRYSTERMFETLIDIADSARDAAPDVFVMWYWGLRSPFWALHGDSIFESGLHMEGSGTSIFPTLYYRDSVTLAQDQNACHARTIPPLVKDSLGVWLADTRWGNYMGKERWREALVMDLARGNLLFPNLWGNLYHLDDEDVGFLARISALARKHESVLLRPRKQIGDPFRNDLYGYAYFDGARGLIFLNNAHFTARGVELRLDAALGVEGEAGTPLAVVSHFPDRSRLRHANGSRVRVGDTLMVWLRPFEVLMLEVGPSARESARPPVRSVWELDAARLGSALALRPAAPDAGLDAPFADAERFEQQGFRKKVASFEAVLPSLEGPPPILAIPVRLRQGDAEWRYSPAVVEIVQVRARIGDRNVQLIPVPDARQFGNTQKAGCSWVLYKLRLDPGWSHRKATIAVHAYLPPEVHAQVEAWVTHRWWQENTRPTPEGYFGEAPS